MPYYLFFVLILLLSSSCEQSPKTSSTNTSEANSSCEPILRWVEEEYDGTAQQSTFPQNTPAYDVKIGGIYYNLNKRERTAEVTYKEISPGDGITPSYEHKVVIPERIKVRDISYLVTTIGWKAFFGCSHLTSVSIPESVKSIGEHAFKYCGHLKSCNVPDRTEIGYGAFDYTPLKKKYKRRYKEREEDEDIDL